MSGHLNEEEWGGFLERIPVDSNKLVAVKSREENPHGLQIVAGF
jgi:hypothetical protein